MLAWMSPQTSLTATKLIALAFLLVALFPSAYMPAGIGLDHSSIWGINVAAHLNYIFGKDVNYTAGPLGYLLFPQDIKNNLIEALCERLIVHGILAWLLFLYVRKAQRAVFVLLFVITFLFSLGLGLSHEYQLLVLQALVLAASLDGTVRPTLGAFLGGVITGFGVVTKFSIGMAALPTLLLAEILRLREKSREQRLAGAASFGAFFVFLLGVILFHFQSFSTFLEWLRISWEITWGYTAAMSLPSRLPLRLLGQICLAVYVILMVLLFQKRSGLQRVALLFSMPIMLAYKHAFIREITHFLNFYPLILALIALLILFSETLREVRLFGLCGFFIFAIAITSIDMVKHLDASRVIQGITGVTGVKNIYSLTTLPTTRAEMAVEGQASLAGDRLPESWVQRIHADRASVDAVPYETSIMPANDLPWQPNPIIQTYQAYTPYLDQRCYRHFMSSRAPGYLVLHFSTIDMRHPLLEGPATIRAILDHYALADYRQKPDRILLERTASAKNSTLDEVARMACQMGEWVTVPPSDGRLYAGIDMPLTFSGQMSRAFLTIPPVTIEVGYADGRSIPYRLIVDSAVDGLLLNELPSTVESAAALFNGRPYEKVTKFRIGGTGSLSYDIHYTVRWLREKRIPPVPN